MFLCCQGRETAKDNESTGSANDEEVASAKPMPEVDVGFKDLDSQHCTPEDSNKDNSDQTSESINSSSVGNDAENDLNKIVEPDHVIDDNSDMVDSTTRKHEMVLNMKAIGKFNDLKYTRMPAKRLRIYSQSGKSES